MVKPIVDTFKENFQLVILGIELANKVLGLQDCQPELNNNPHAEKAFKIAQKWNEKFIETYTQQGRE